MTDRIIFQAPFITVKETPHGFQYAERKGKNSIALFLVRRTELGLSVLVRNQPLPIHNAEKGEDQVLFPCPITGSIAKEHALAPFCTALEEAYEEGGYELSMSDIKLLGTYVVGTQTNEYVYMYYADVTNLSPVEAKGDGSYFESVSNNEWKPLSYLQECEYVACQLGYYKLRDLYDR